MVTAPQVTRLAALLLLAVTGVHEARYRLLVPHDSGESLGGLGHGAGGVGSVLAIVASVIFAALVLRALASPAATSCWPTWAECRTSLNGLSTAPRRKAKQ